MFKAKEDLIIILFSVNKIPKQILAIITIIIIIIIRRSLISKRSYLPCNSKKEELI